jgi:hypothetical protein
MKPRVFLIVCIVLIVLLSALDEYLDQRAEDRPPIVGGEGTLSFNPSSAQEISCRRESLK